MKRFPINFTDELLNWLIASQGGYGFATTSSFIRHIIIRFKKQETNHKWSDVDMLDWGKHLNQFLNTPREPYVLEDKEIAIRKEFSNYKRTRA